MYSLAQRCVALKHREAKLIQTTTLKYPIGIAHVLTNIARQAQNAVQDKSTWEG